MPFFAVLKNCLFTYKKPFFRTNLFYCHPKLLFSTLRRPFQPTLTYCLQKIPIFTNQKPFIRTNLSLFPSKAILFCPPPPIRTTLNLLFAKNTAVLLLFALILCCKVWASHRFKAFSPAFCRQNRFRHEPPESFTKSFPAELWIVPGVQRFANLWRAFWFFLHDAKRT